MTTDELNKSSDETRSNQNAPEAPPAEAGPAPSGSLKIACSRRFTDWLQGLHVSLAFTTYQACRLFLVGLKPNNQLSAFERLFDRAMGLYATPDQIYLSSTFQIWRFENVLAPGEDYNGFDRLYVPRTSHTTGNLDVHDMALDRDGRVIFVNTRYSCLATLSDRHSFKPLWKPDFISDLVPEDRCHLNGLAMVDGRPRYMTSVSRSDTAEGWREHRASGGVVLDVESGEVVCDGLSMPHSPRFYQDRLWLLNSGTGEFGRVDLERGVFEPIVFCPGYLRGLTFYGNHAVVGMSEPRRNKAFAGLELDERLEEFDLKARCGLVVIDIHSGEILHWLQMSGVVNELYDVQVLPMVRRPTALGMRANDVRRIISIDASPGFEDVLPRALHVLQAAQDEASKAAETAHQVLVYEGLDRTRAAEYVDYTFPSIRKRWYARPPAGTLAAVVASADDRTLGTAMAEISPDGLSAEIISLFVVRDRRRQGLGRELLNTLEQTLVQMGCATVKLNYRSDWSSVSTLEAMLVKAEWSAPKAINIMYKTSSEKLRQTPMVSKYPLPEGYEIFPWIELTARERFEIERRLENLPVFPVGLSPFQREDKMEPINSLGLRHNGHVIGWIVTHRTAPDLIQTTSLYVPPDHRRQGLSDILLVECMNRRLAAGVPYGSSLVDPRNRKVLDYLDRRLEPYLVSRVEFLESVKPLIPGDGNFG